MSSYRSSWTQKNGCGDHSSVLLGPGIFYALLFSSCFSLLPSVFVQPSLLLISCKDTAEECSEVSRLCMLLVTQQPLHFEFQCLAAQCSMCTACSITAPLQTKRSQHEKVSFILFYFILFVLFCFILCLFAPNDPLVSYAAEHGKRK